MLYDWNDLILQMDGAYPGVHANSVSAAADVDIAWARWGQANYNSCLYYTLAAVQHLENQGKDIVGYFFWGYNGYDSMIPLAFKILKGIVDDISPEIDMDTIISAMMEATPDQIEYFIGIVDAYRQSIWKRPFNQEFFAALARGFEQWP